MTRRGAAWLAVGLVVAFWGLTVWHLDRAPSVNEGEALILSLAHGVAERGALGTELFTGYYGMDHHYLVITPLMSVVQSVIILAAGVGIFQARWAAAAAGALALALTFRMGSKLTTPGTALLAGLLLVAWQWAPANVHALVRSGIPLIDVARVVRHDILVAPLGLGAWWAGLAAARARGRAAPALGFASGLLTGLSGLAHLYGLFWAPVIGLLLVTERRGHGRGWWWQAPGLLALGVMVVWLPVIVTMRRYTDDFAVQSRQSTSRFQFLDSAFYRDNVRNEIQRYHLGIRSGAFHTRAGGWALVAGAPAALAWLGLRVARCDKRARWLWLPSAALPVLLAVLIQPKTFSYLILVAPPLALALAAGAMHLVRRPGAIGRWIVWPAVALVVIQGGLSIAQLHRAAAEAPAPGAVFGALRSLIPREARLLGHRSYWIGLYDRDYRCFGLAFILSNSALTPDAVDMTQALGQLDPEYVLLDSAVRQEFNHPSTPESERNAAAFWDYLAANQARSLGVVPDLEGKTLEVFVLGR